jgi:putative redox protein
MSGKGDHVIAVASVSSEAMPYGIRIDAGGHPLRSDEPTSHGGGNTGPAPFGLLLSGLGACTAITLRMYAERKHWPLEHVDVQLTYIVKDRASRWIERLITLSGPLDDDHRANWPRSPRRHRSPRRYAPEPRSAPPSTRPDQQPRGRADLFATAPVESRPCIDRPVDPWPQRNRRVGHHRPRSMACR